MYVQTTLDVHKKYNALVMSAFNNDAGFVAALDKVRSRSVSPASRDVSEDFAVTRLVFLSLSAGVWSIHQQQRRHQDGSVVQQVPRAAGQILRLFTEEEVGDVTVYTYGHFHISCKKYIFCVIANVRGSNMNRISCMAFIASLGCAF